MLKGDPQACLRYLRLAIGLCLLCCVWACDVAWDDRGQTSPLGAGLVERDSGGITMPPPLTADSTGRQHTQRGSLEWLLVGRSRGRTATTLIKFSGLPDTLAIDEARLVLSAFAYAWEGTEEALVAKAADVAWSEDDDPIVLPAAVREETLTIAVADTMAAGHPLEHVVPLEWVQGASEVAFLLEPGVGTGSSAFGSSEGSSGPALELAYTENDSAKVRTYRASEDTYHLAGPPEAEGALISQAEPAGVRVWFDPLEIGVSPDTTVVAATLSMENLSPHVGVDLELVVYRGEDFVQEAGRAAVNVSDTGCSIALSAASVRQMQSWVTEPPDSGYVLLLRFPAQGQGMGWLEVGSPTLSLVYSISPSLE